MIYFLSLYLIPPSKVCTRAETHVLLHKQAFHIKYSPKESSANSDFAVETLLYGKRQSPVSQAGTVHGGKAGRDGYAHLSDSYFTHTVSSQAEYEYV